MKKYKLPMISRFFLSFFLNHSHPDEMMGDLDEMYYDITKEKGNIIARLWYWFQIILAIPSFFKNAFYWSGIMFKNYLKIAYRNILRHKTYSFINIAGLATGMTISILILAWIQNELSYDTFHENSERIYRITQKHNNPESGYTPHFARCSFDWIKELQGEIPEIKSIVRFGHRRRTIKARDNKFNVNNFFMTDSNVFEVFSFKLIQGDPKTALKNANNAVITREIAEKCFGYNDPIGKTIETFSRGDHQGKLFTITGVMENIPKNSHFHPEILASIKSDEREGGWYYTYLFVEPHCITEELEKKIMPLIERNLGEKAASIISFPLQKLTDIHLHSNINRELESNGNIIYIYMFSAIAILILLIASINFMNLSTARWTKRAKEVSIRKVLGSKRSQLISYFLGESMLFSITGFIIAIIFSIIFLPVFNELTGKVISLSLKNNRVIYLVLSLIVFITGLVSGSY
ncbi:MAG: ABC transporter permease, partial [Calditrichia bacterium]|nr:ABC transporter permease [Calditrichia bacterium]